MKEEIAKLKEEYFEKARKIREQDMPYFNSKNKGPYLKLTIELQEKIKKIKEKYSTQK